MSNDKRYTVTATAMPPNDCKDDTKRLACFRPDCLRSQYDPDEDGISGGRVDILASTIEDGMSQAPKGYDKDVEHPAHYAPNGGVECIDVIKQVLSPEQFQGFLIGNVIKYVFRHRAKGKPLQDLKKAEWYLSRAIKETEGRDG